MSEEETKTESKTEETVIKKEAEDKKDIKTSGEEAQPKTEPAKTEDVKEVKKLSPFDEFKQLVTDQQTQMKAQFAEMNKKIDASIKSKLAEQKKEEESVKPTENEGSAGLSDNTKPQFDAQSVIDAIDEGKLDPKKAAKLLGNKIQMEWIERHSRGM